MCSLLSKHLECHELKMNLYSETELEAANETHVQTFFTQQVERGVWRLSDGLEIVHYSVFHPNASGIIVISSGRSECAIKYAELIHDLYRNGYSVFIHDHRGQGESSRLSENPHHGYIESFSDYVDDFENILDKVLQPLLEKHQQSNIKKFLLSHSMGGAIAALLLLKRQSFFSKAIFSSPMFGIAPPIPIWIARVLLNLNLFITKLRGKKASYFIGESDYQAFPFHKNRLTQSEVRYRLFKTAYADNPQVQLGGVTSWWIVQALSALEYIQQNAQKIVLPCLVLKSGSDLIVSNDAIDQINSKLPNSSLVTVENAMHELFFEQDSMRAQCLNAIDAFISD